MEMDRLLANRRDNNASPPGQGLDHEMANLNNGQSGFLAETASIQDSISEFNRNVQAIATLNSRSLNTVPLSEKDPSHEDIARQLHSVTEETRSLSNNIRERIRKLGEEDMTRLTPSELTTRKNMITRVRTKFLDALQEYQRVEQDYRTKSRQRVERQYRIVNPAATPEEVRAVVEGGETQIFAQAMNTSTGRYNESRTAYREVQARHEDLKLMERTLAELVQLFSDMSVMVEQQNDIFENLEKTTAEVESNTKAGMVHTEKARDHAASARRKRWIIFGICVLVIAIIALALGLKFGLPSNNNNSGNSGNTNSTQS